jgi:isopenicillin-N epimerase
MSAEFGRTARAQFSLDRDGVFLNHGSFGATPKSVLAAQSRWRETMENQPDIFFRRLMRPGVRAAAEVLAPVIGSRAEDLAFMENPTAGINTVLQRLSYRPGDEILIASTTYNAVRLSVEDVRQRFGVSIKTLNLPLPLTDMTEAVDLYISALGPRTKLAIVDHIVSPTGFVLPVARIAAALKRKGVMVMIDGAHAAGQIPLDVSRIGADWYTGTLHK